MQTLAFRVLALLLSPLRWLHGRVSLLRPHEQHPILTASPIVPGYPCHPTRAITPLVTPTALSKTECRKTYHRHRGCLHPNPDMKTRLPLRKRKSRPSLRFPRPTSRPKPKGSRWHLSPESLACHWNCLKNRAVQGKWIRILPVQGPVMLTKKVSVTPDSVGTTPNQILGKGPVPMPIKRISNR